MRVYRTTRTGGWAQYALDGAKTGESLALSCERDLTLDADDVTGLKAKC